MARLLSFTVGDLLSGSVYNVVKKVDHDEVLPFIIVPILLRIMAISFTASLFVMIMIAMGVLYVISRPRKKNRSPFFFSWILSSILYMYLVYIYVVLNYWRITIAENLILIAAILCTCFFFYKMKAVASRELTGKGKEYSPVLTSDSHYCQICQLEVNERQFHSIWWDCCVFRPNYRYFIAAQICAFMSLTIGINYSLTTTCYPYLFYYNILLPYNCDYVYMQYWSALIFATNVYASGYLFVVILVLFHQLFINVRKVCGKLSHSSSSALNF